MNEEQVTEKTFREWAILELLGHRRLAGLVTEQEIAGKGFLRIDIPGPEDQTVTQFYSPDSVYGLTPTTEEIARRVAVRNSPAPVSHWELALPEGSKQADIDVDPDDEEVPAPF